MLRKKIIWRLYCFIAVCFGLGCNKDYLDKKPDQALLVPSSLNDFQALLDNGNVMFQEPELNEFASDDFYILDDYYPYLAIPAQNSYIWAKDVYQGGSIADWNNCYKQVFYSNIVLEGLAKDKLLAGSEKQGNSLKGAALFYRANAYFNLAQVFAAPYNTANLALPGIPVKLGSDVNIITPRGTLAETYDQIKADLWNALPLLPETVSFKNRPTKSAAYGLLARVFLTMGKYGDALTAANNYLGLTNSLIDYNSLDPSKSRPFPKALPFDNIEVVSYSSLVGYGIEEIGFVDPSLYQSYDKNDLRKTLFFNDQGDGAIVFKGSYTGNYNWFNGISTNEIYLIRAESSIRGGDVKSGLNDLNMLLAKRWKKGTFQPFEGLSQSDALSTTLKERRKELIGRGLRWQDLRRLSTDPNYAVTLTRTLNGTVYKLLPGDNRYVFPIPSDEINNSGITQNPR